jgi:hypothetical protein
MQIKELIEALKRLPPNAHVVVAGVVIHGVALYRGSVQIGYYNPHWIRDKKGKETAVMFLANTEISTGEVESMPK